jgi:hypothetical protein
MTEQEELIQDIRERLGEMPKCRLICWRLPPLQASATR